MHDNMESLDSVDTSVEETSHLETEELPALVSSSAAGWLSGWTRLIVGVVVLAVLAALVGPQLVNQARYDRSDAVVEFTGGSLRDTCSD